MFQSFHQLQERCENGKKAWKSNKLRRILTCNCDAPQNRNDLSSLQNYQHLFVYKRHFKPPQKKWLMPSPNHTLLTYQWKKLSTY